MSARRLAATKRWTRDASGAGAGPGPKRGTVRTAAIRAMDISAGSSVSVHGSSTPNRPKYMSRPITATATKLTELLIRKNATERRAIRSPSMPPCQGGMDGDLIARRSVAFFLIKSSVNFVAVAVIGLLMYLGLFGVDEPWTLTLLPALMSIALIAAVLTVPRFGPGPAPAPDASRVQRFVAASRRALITGTSVAVERVRSGNVRILAGAIGYWAFDNAVLWATFHAFGYSPEISIVLMGYL